MTLIKILANVQHRHGRSEACEMITKSAEITAGAVTDATQGLAREDVQHEVYSMLVELTSSPRPDIGLRLREKDFPFKISSAWYELDGSSEKYGLELLGGEFIRNCSLMQKLSNYMRRKRLRCS